MISISPSAQEKVWLDKSRYDAAERKYYERLAQSSELGKVSIISDSSDQQECAGVDQEKEIEIDPNSCQNDVSEQKTPPKSPKGSKIDQKDAVKPKGKEVLPNKDADMSHPKVEENVCIKQGTALSNVVQPPKPDVCVVSPQTDMESNKTIGKNKETGNEVCNLLKSKEEVCSKTEITKKSEDQNKITNSSKADMNTHKKVESGDITCPKVKGQAKPKAVDDKIVNKEIINEKVNSGIDTASEIIKIDDIAVTSNTVSVEITNRINALEKENVELKTQVNQLTELLKKMDLRISSMEKSNASSSKPDNKAPAPHVKKDDAEDDDGVDLFGSDSEDEDTEAAKIKEQRLAEYAARKAKKPVLIAKSNIILDVKPWDDETDMKQLEAEVRKISTDGLVWGASKLVPLAYGIHKLQISCVVEDDKVSVDWLQETIEEITDYVQSVDIAAFNKV